VQEAVGEPFDRWSERELFAPLGMEHTAWKLARLEGDVVAHPHYRLPVGFWVGAHYGYPDYPDGQLRSTPSDVGRLLGAVWAEGGPPSKGRLGWERRFLEGTALVGHGGSDRGVHTQAWIAQETGDGYVLLLDARVSSPEKVAARVCLERGLLGAAQQGW